MRSLVKYLSEPWLIAIGLNNHGLGAFIPDSLYLKCIFRERMGYSLNLKKPCTFNEKLQWLKLHNRNPIYTKLVDKYEVKKYVARIIGDEYIIPTLGVWNKFDDIDFDKLPNQFVLKCTHDSGGIVICKDKTKFNIDEARNKINSSLKVNYYLLGREWPYKNVKPRIIAEQYLSNSDEKDSLSGYKLHHNFNGVPKMVLVCKDSLSEQGMSDDFFETRWEHIPVHHLKSSNNRVRIEETKQLLEMLELVERLSADIPFGRANFYTVQGKVYFAEITFCPSEELLQFRTDSYDKLFGNWLVLPTPDSVCGGVMLHKDNMFVLVHAEPKSDEGLFDYKFFCFNGKVKCFKIDYDRYINHSANYYDTNMQLLPFGEEVCPPNPSRHIDIPESIDDMILLAEKLSKNIPFLRVDFYYVNNRIYFGELTFYPASGFGKFTVDEWDNKLGNMIDLRHNR